MSPQDLRDRPQKSPDPLSEVLRLVEARGVVSGAVTADGAWTTSVDLTEPLKFVAMVSGGVRVQTDGVTPVQVGAGDVVVLNHRRRLPLSSASAGAARRRGRPRRG